jgi:hypothetical protein
MDVAEFREDNQAYLSWVHAHPDGFVINIQRSLNPSDARMHRATCYTIRGEPPRGNFVGEYIKICSPSQIDLTQWALKSVGSIHDCGTCRPSGHMSSAELGSMSKGRPLTRETSPRPGWPGREVARPTAMSNRDRVDRGMGLLATGLRPFVEKRMIEALHGGKDWMTIWVARNPARYSVGHHYSLSDPRFLLRVITEEWRLFKDQLSRVEQGFATELRDAGNRWAHWDRPFSDDDTFRTLDTMERLLNAIGAPDEAVQVRALRSEHRR